MRVVRRAPLTSRDYAALDKPTVQRQRAVGDGLRPDTDARICWIFRHSCVARPIEAVR